MYDTNHPLLASKTAKSIELDERIPFISKLQRYSGLVNFRPRDFQQAEQVILKELEWKLQCATTIDVVEYYLSQGVVFSSDLLEEEMEVKEEEVEEEQDSERSEFKNLIHKFWKSDHE